MDLWVEESHRDVIAQRYRVRQVLFSEQSPFQRVEIVETEGLGKMLLHDGLVMITERDEGIYHDMIAHVPLFVHPEPQKVLVIGGGDGGTVREVLRHPSVQSCRLVEIDGLVIDACRQHFSFTSAALDDPRVTVQIDDGVRFVRETSERFDVVIVDSTDPIGPAAPLFGSEFYGDVQRVLTPQGLVVSQAESPFYEQELQYSLVKILKEVFPKTHIYNYSNLTYPGGLWSFTFASQGLCPLGDFHLDRVLTSGLEFFYYSAAVHRAAFCLPAFMARDLQDLLTPFHSAGDQRR
jgi:spermidine synthase